MVESTHQAESAQGHHGVPVEAYINKLTPPPGTNYWRHQSFTLMKDQQFIYYPEDPITINFLVQTLTWKIDAYVYAVDAQPGDNFAGRGHSEHLTISLGGIS
ncbi:hypothetical protein ONZ45_g7691 [Pleurotus djamor]|nr:hypothetical protein ONZ45_g7691 [Pleurotus djamor]